MDFLFPFFSSHLAFLKVLEYLDYFIWFMILRPHGVEGEGDWDGYSLAAMLRSSCLGIGEIREFYFRILVIRMQIIMKENGIFLERFILPRKGVF